MASSDRGMAAGRWKETVYAAHTIIKGQQFGWRPALVPPTVSRRAGCNAPLIGARRSDRSEVAPSARISAITGARSDARAFALSVLTSRAFAQLQSGPRLALSRFASLVIWSTMPA